MGNLMTSLFSYAFITVLMGAKSKGQILVHIWRLIKIYIVISNMGHRSSSTKKIEFVDRKPLLIVDIANMVIFVTMDIYLKIQVLKITSQGLSEGCF